MARIILAIDKDSLPKYHEPAGACNIHMLYPVERVK